MCERESLSTGIGGWCYFSPVCLDQASQMAPAVKNLLANVGDKRDVSSVPESGRSPGKGLGNPLQHSCLENPM